MQVGAESFHLNGHIIGFHPETQKLPYKTPSSTLAVKGLSKGSQRIAKTDEEKPNKRVELTPSQLASKIARIKRDWILQTNEDYNF